MPTTGYQAGVESNQVLISYALESVFATLPTVAFQAIRITGDSLSGSKTRARPAELNTTGEVSAAVTTQQTATGSISFALSFATYDALIAAGLNSAWQTPVAIAGVAGDITITTGTNVLSSTTAGKFAAISVGQWIRLLGFTNAVNNGIFRVTAKADAQTLTLSLPYTGVSGLNPVAGAFVTETPAAAAAQIRASTLINGTTLQTLFLQKKFAAALFLRYPGSYVSAMTLTGGVGNFLSGSFTILATDETASTTDASTGAVTAAPTGKVHDPVNGFKGFYIDAAPIAAVLDSFTATFTNTGAASEYGMGSASSQGVILGLQTATGQIKVYFATQAIYNRYKAETGGVLSFITQDAAGNAYVITFLNGTFQNPKINAGSQNTAVMATFDIEGNPQAAGGTVQIDRLPAV